MRRETHAWVTGKFPSADRTAIGPFGGDEKTGNTGKVKFSAFLEAEIGMSPGREQYPE